MVLQLRTLPLWWGCNICWYWRIWKFWLWFHHNTSSCWTYACWKILPRFLSQRVVSCVCMKFGKRQGRGAWHSLELLHSPAALDKSLGLLSALEIPRTQVSCCHTLTQGVICKCGAGNPHGNPPSFSPLQPPALVYTDPGISLHGDSWSVIFIEA